MRKSKDFSIPGNIPHASGRYFAYHWFIEAMVLFAIAIIICLVFFKEDKKVISGLFSVGSILVLIYSAGGYLFGSKDLENINKYLNYLKQKFEKEINRLESDQSLDEELNKRMFLLKDVIKIYFKDSIKNFLLIKSFKDNVDPYVKEFFSEFEKKLSGMKDENLKEVGKHLQNIFNQYATDSVSTENSIKFDKKWLEKFDFYSYREGTRKLVSISFFKKRESLIKDVQKIDKIILDYAQEKVFS